jgi:hypothetical protein
MSETKKSSSSPAPDRETVLVPPAGVHTPGTTAMGGETAYVEAPADAASDPAAARDAYERAQAGESDVTLPDGVIPQNADGSAMTRPEAEQAVEDEQQVREDIEGRTSGDATTGRAKGARPK